MGFVIKIHKTSKTDCLNFLGKAKLFKTIDLKRFFSFSITLDKLMT